MSCVYSNSVWPGRLLCGGFQLLSADNVLAAGQEWSQICVPVSSVDRTVCSRSTRHEGTASETGDKVPLRFGGQRRQQPKNLRRLQRHAGLPRIPRRFQNLSDKNGGVAYRVVEAVGRTQAYGTEGIRKERIQECVVRAVFIDYAKAFIVLITL